MTNAKNLLRDAASSARDLHRPRSVSQDELDRLIEKARQSSPTNMLRLSQVQQRVPKCKSAIWKDVSDGVFVQPIRIGARSVAWIESEIDIWLEATVFNSRSSSEIDMKQLVSRLVSLHASP
jgi:prophage regulatory protein